jgi:uroporphyrinogen decarboxylase
MATMTTPLLDHPDPDFAELERVLKGERTPRRVHLVELLIDEENLQAINERYLGQAWIPSTAGDQELYYQQIVTLYYRLGYDYVPVPQWPTLWINHPPPQWQEAADTADLSRGKRAWANESRGLIGSLEELERFPWDDIRPDVTPYELVARNLPDGLKIVVETNFFEHVLETLLGYEGLFYLLYDNPQLVAQVFRRWGKKTYDFYQSVLDLEGVGAIFHADDLGFKTSTLLSPGALRQLFFPWLKKYAALAHAHGKMFWYHACGNLYNSVVIEDLIEDVQIDAFHSFQDVILPVAEFKARYGERVATLGGVDLDALTRMGEADLRAYVRDILAHCMPGGRFALGSGNSVPNYTPLRNYCIMLDEARRWSG